MPVNIEEVLGLLPEMFPGAQQIPLKNIRPNPNNPGAPLTDLEIQDLAQNIAEAGLLNPIKVQPEKGNPLAGGVQLPTANPRLRADGQPWALGDFNFEILAGENRYRAFDYLKREAIPGFILNPTAKEAVKITHLDNDVRDRGWWAAYQTIEQYIQADPNLTQRQVAVELKMHLPKVNRALGLLALLNPASRDLIVRNCNNSNKGNWGISEAAALRLADLGPGGSLKRGVRKEGEDTQRLWPYPSIPDETQDLVRQSLETAFELELTEAGVKALVGWVQEGHKPEEYRVAASGKLGVKAKAQPETSMPHSAPTGSAGSPQVGAGARDDSQNEVEEEDDEEFKPIPWSENSKHPEYRDVPVDRVRVNPFIANLYARSMDVERKVAAMKATGSAQEIRVRNLSAEESAADPDNDYELFEGPLTLKGAQVLGWPNLRAFVYAIDEWEGVRLHNFELRHSTPLTWIEIYGWLEKRVAENPQKTAAEWAISIEEDPALVERVLPVLKLLNEPARDAICLSERRCYEGRVNMGGYRFVQELSIPLIRLGKISKDLAEAKALVEKVVGVEFPRFSGQPSLV
ncbi:MAG TPA: ParB/RepB/Spo0J family partition protein [bacterium]